jgi:hypothetical protein
MKKLNKKQKPGQKPDLPKGAYAFIVGNGTSRKDLDLHTIKDYGLLFACNWFFHKEFRPDVLVASDEPMTNTILKAHSYYPKTNWFFTWFPKPGSGAKKAPTPEKFAAGPMATYTACHTFEAKKVFLIGMDFFGFGSNDKNDNGTLNNLYANAKHYQKTTENDAGHAPTYRNWQRRFQYVLRKFPNVEFYHVNPFEGKSPERLRGFNNFHQISWENLQEHLNNDAPLIDLLTKTEEDIQLATEMNPDDERARYERQLAGQENVIFTDPMSDDQVIALRIQGAKYFRANGTEKGHPLVKVDGHDLILFPSQTRTSEGVRNMTDVEIVAEYRREAIERERLRKEQSSLL